MTKQSDYILFRAQEASDAARKREQERQKQQEAVQQAKNARALEELRAFFAREFQDDLLLLEALSPAYSFPTAPTSCVTIAWTPCVMLTYEAFTWQITRNVHPLFPASTGWNWLVCRMNQEGATVKQMTVDQCDLKETLLLQIADVLEAPR